MKKIMLGTLICGVAAFASVNLNTCVGCHGKNFEKKALGKSKIVKDLTKEEVSNALVGYKKGTYGASMKGIMRGQVAKYTEKELMSTGLGINKKDQQ